MSEELKLDGIVFEGEIYVKETDCRKEINKTLAINLKATEDLRRQLAKCQEDLAYAKNELNDIDMRSPVVSGEIELQQEVIDIRRQLSEK